MPEAFMLETYYRIDVNLITAILLVIITFLARARLDRKDKLNRAFMTTIWIVIVELIIEVLTCVINKQPYSWLIPISVILHMMLFVTAPILTFYWHTLFRGFFSPKKKKYHWSEYAIAIPMFLAVLFALLSPFLGWVFVIDQDNVYHRGNLFFFEMAVLFFYFILTLVMIFINQVKMSRKDRSLLVLTTLLPVLGGLLQMSVYGVLSIWSSSGFSLIILFVFLQQHLIHLDNLTGAWSRESFEYHLTQRINFRRDDKFAAIFFDVDGLKAINDRFGHAEGDFALKEAVRLIRSAIGENGQISRFGGDEFIALINSDSQQFLTDTMAKITQVFLEYNSQSQKGYLLELSYGADVFDSRFQALDQFFHHIDRLMYQNKNTKKQLKRNEPETSPQTNL